MKILLANGDSHTSGSYPGSTTPHNKDSVWAKFLADELNLKYLNISTAGAGTEEISMSTITSVHTLVEQHKVDPADILVCVLWGIDNRKYQFWNGEHHQSYCLEATWDAPETVKDYVESRTKLETNGYDAFKDLYNIYLTAIALERYNVQYLFMNTKPFVEPSEEKIKNLYGNILYLYGDRINYHFGFNNFDESFDGFLSQNATPMVMSGPEKKMPYWDVSAQKLWKEFIHGRMGN
jgi:hypothetical protein